MSTCNRGLVSQVSTGQAGVEVNRDLETLFRRVNELQTCLNLVVEQLNATTNGGFASGDGGVTSGGGGFNHIPVEGGPLRMSSGSNLSIPDGFSGLVMIDATANINVTLPIPIAGNQITVMNVGAASTITIKDDLGNSLTPTITTGGFMNVQPVEDAANAPEWPAAAVVQYPSGTIHIPGDLVVVSASNALVLKDTATGDYYDVTVASGAMAPLNTGGAIPPT